MPALNWSDLEGIALALQEKFPDLDPTHIRYTCLLYTSDAADE